MDILHDRIVEISLIKIMPDGQEIEKTRRVPCSLYFINRVGGKEGISMKSDKWVWMAIGATVI